MIDIFSRKGLFEGGLLRPWEKSYPYHAEMNEQKLGVNWSAGAEGGSPSTMASISS